MVRYWLFKSEPEVYSIDSLEKDGSTFWSGIRNYQARNYLRDDVSTGDWVLFYHSNATPPGVAGVAKVCKKAYPDHLQFDKKSEYVDERSNPDDPTWVMVDIAFEEKFPAIVSLDALRATPALGQMQVIRRGQRLSIQPVTKEEFFAVRRMGRSALDASSVGSNIGEDE